MGTQGKTVDKGELMMQTLDSYGTRYKPNHMGWQSVSCPNIAGHVHGDKTPSARVNLTYGYLFCNACTIRGDAYSLLMEMEGLSFKDALGRLGSPVGADPESDWLF